MMGIDTAKNIGQIANALTRIAHSQEQMNIRFARIEAALDILNQNIGKLR